MLGRIRWGSGRKSIIRVEEILELPILTLELPQHVRRPERLLRKAAAQLCSRRVKSVLTPPDFPWWQLLLQAGLRPVDTGLLRCVLAPRWVAVQLERQGISREEAVLRLKGEEEELLPGELVCALCPLARSLVFDFPGGERMADHIRRETGMPVLPRNFDGVHLTLHLHNGPLLTGAEITLSDRQLPADCEQWELLSVLWESGRIKTEEIVLKL